MFAGNADEFLCLAKLSSVLKDYKQLYGFLLELNQIFAVKLISLQCSKFQCPKSDWENPALFCMLCKRDSLGSLLNVSQANEIK